MENRNRWRSARFRSPEERDEFVDHARSIDLKGFDLETLPDGLRVRFRAPARFEIGLAGMVDAHGGTILPSPSLPEPSKLPVA